MLAKLFNNTCTVCNSTKMDLYIGYTVIVAFSNCQSSMLVVADKKIVASSEGDDPTFGNNCTIRTQLSKKEGNFSCMVVIYFPLVLGVLQVLMRVHC